MPVLRNSDSPNIVVQFAHVAKRNAVVEKVKKKRVNCADVGFSSRSPAFVNEHLCPTLKRLFGATVAKKKDCAWLYAWTSNGKLSARKTETPKVVHIACPEELSQVVSEV